MSEIHLPPVDAAHYNRALRIIAELAIGRGDQIELPTERAAAVIATLLASVDFYKGNYERVVDEKTDLDGECISLALRLSDTGQMQTALKAALTRFFADVEAALKRPTHTSNG